VLSDRRLSEILRGADAKLKVVHTRIGKGVPTSPSSIRVVIEKLERSLNGGRPLTDRDKGARRSGGLTPDGESFLREVQRYLSGKGRWADETA
jgi:hypothetical protein